jgi:hypothetical protein
VLEIPAIVIIGIWFVLQYISAMVELDDERFGGGGVAYWAHLGGFAAGFVILRGMIFHLRRQQDQGVATEAEPLAPAVDGFLPVDQMPVDVIEDPLERGLKAGAPDPFATFLSVQTVRKIKEQSEQK